MVMKARDSDGGMVEGGGGGGGGGGGREDWLWQRWRGGRRSQQWAPAGV